MCFAARRLKRVANQFFRLQREAPPAELPALLDRAQRYVRAECGALTAESAVDLAVLEAWSALAAERARSYVDLEASTPQLLVLVDEVSKGRRYVPVIDLVRILGFRVAAAG